MDILKDDKINKNKDYILILKLYSGRIKNI